MSTGTTFLQAARAAELAITRMALFSMLSREVEVHPGVTELRAQVTLDGPGLQTIEIQALTSDGRVVSGYAL